MSIFGTFPLEALLNMGLFGLIGSLLGLTAAALFYKFRVTRLTLQKDSHAAILQETIRIQSDEVDEVKGLLNRVHGDLDSANARILKISEERSAALSKLEYLAVLEKKLADSQATEVDWQRENSTLKQQIAHLETVVEKERKTTEEKIALLEDVRAGMTDAYRAVSANALEKNNQAFMDLANTTLAKYMESAKADFELRSRAVKDVVLPVKEALARYDEYVRSVERQREKAYGGLSEQLYSLIKTQTDLQKETGKLVKAMRVPHVRGRWGEITLRRVAELAGMENRCDFFEQPTTRSENGMLRPDMIVALPGNRRIVVDSKVPISAYLDALEAETDEKRNEFLAAHARHVHNHIQQLSQKTYWAQFQPAPEFVVMFIPGENFFSAALSQNTGLIEYGVERNVIPATPTTLITLLKTVAFGWRQEAMAQNAKIISDLGSELYERLNIMAKHLHKLGREIERAAVTYNQVAGSFERRVLTSARKFTELGINLKSDKELLAMEPVETKPREIDYDDNE